MPFPTKARTLLAAVAMALATASGALADKIELLDAAPEDALVVNIDKMKYETPEITIKAGDAVTWTNQEVMPHNVHFLAGVVADEAVKGTMLKKDESWSARFNEPGTYDYHCTPHPFMRGKVVVE
ncbi:amicyanin [Paracoccus siganidrum]|uniref:Amicyanin n=1 Tax=Paracoccus siganidrum TaxID=1276757 RepID=A0A418ZSZ5_9RHOB|nr:amicyanin [Paracoccus siganidrum]RJK99784.1 amicyanin [Paracoccus siganidrum]RMC39589.1 amicyanin [Paracoccus siganidrum]